jgi:hypothetical protein
MDVQWNRPVFKAPPLDVRIPAPDVLGLSPLARKDA